MFTFYPYLPMDKPILLVNLTLIINNLRVGKNGVGDIVGKGV